ncbi:MAG TPA: hypothetical protein VIV58_23415, partial [Kofleriaceae bacterium]
MITADNITDEQIRELSVRAASFGLDDVESWCDIALGECPFYVPSGFKTSAEDQRKARARCAE